MRSLILIAFLSVFSLTWSQDNNFSNQTIEKFADAYKLVRAESMSFQLNKLTAIEDAGLTSDEFTDIHIKLKDPNAEEQPSDVEVRKYKLALKNIEELNTSIQESIERIIQDKGLKVETYQSIAKASMTDTILKNKIQKHLE